MTKETDWRDVEDGLAEYGFPYYAEDIKSGHIKLITAECQVWGIKRWCPVPDPPPIPEPEPELPTINPCPNVGCKLEPFTKGSENIAVRVVCICGVTGKYSLTVKEAIEWWNKAFPLPWRSVKDDPPEAEQWIQLVKGKISFVSYLGVDRTASINGLVEPITYFDLWAPLLKSPGEESK